MTPHANHDTEITGRPQSRFQLSGGNDSQISQEPEYLEAEQREDRIRSVFGLTYDRPLPRCNQRTLLVYHAYLATHLAFPLVARYWEEVNLFEGVGHVVSVLGLLDPDARPFDASIGLLCLARMENLLAELPLVELELHDGSPDARLIEDYWYWLWNWRAGA